MIESETQIRATGFRLRKGQGYNSGATAFPFYCSLFLMESKGAKVGLLIPLPAEHGRCHMLG